MSSRTKVVFNRFPDLSPNERADRDIFYESNPQDVI